MYSDTYSTAVDMIMVVIMYIYVKKLKNFSYKCNILYYAVYIKNYICTILNYRW